jgi:hypothetical protein
LSSVPLTQAVTAGDAAAVNAGLANGADVNERTGGGQTPLILATIFGHTHLIPLLLDAGADPQLRDNLGLNAIDWAQRRGATEAIEVIKNKSGETLQDGFGPGTQTRPPKPARLLNPEAEKPRSVSDDERSRRWIAGLKQRIAEQSQTENPEGPNLFRQQSSAPASSSFEAPDTPGPEILEEPKPQPEIPAQPEPQPEIPATPPDPQPEIPDHPPEPEIPSPPAEPEPRVEGAGATTDAAVATTRDESLRSSTRKRCPQCNAIYNSELVAYCAYHAVPLVDADAPPIISEPSKASPVMFWVIIVVTLAGSIIIGSLITAYLFRSPPPAQQQASTPPPPTAVQKGTPVLDKELHGKAVSLPIAECPLNGQEAIPGTVTVRVVIDKSGKVKEAQATGGDWLLRGAASEAAMKTTFAPARLRGRDTEGTITYTFGP